MKKVKLKPIGRVKNDKSEEPRHPKWQDVRSEIVLMKKFEEALDGIEDYSHILVVFWMNGVAESSRSLKKIVPYGLKDVGPKGIFATRMPERPNPIGVSVVKLLKRERNVLEVQGLDAFNNTPVLDIKPYNGRERDLIKDFKIPKWEKKKHNS